MLYCKVRFDVAIGCNEIFKRVWRWKLHVDIFPHLYHNKKKTFKQKRYFIYCKFGVNLWNTVNWQYYKIMFFFEYYPLRSLEPFRYLWNEREYYVLPNFCNYDVLMCCICDIVATLIISWQGNAMIKESLHIILKIFKWILKIPTYILRLICSIYFLYLGLI